ncbi:MAG TPA: hypothetical protein VLJ76_02365 [Gaiellaceae bacterium]|nr:hypothetical protein [Gaiellaceae bacterium]
MTKPDDHDRKQQQDELALDAEEIKDLDVNDREVEHVQGGVSAGPTRPGSIQSLNVRG